jgi:hypothetical protein
MAEIVAEWECGVISASFTAEAFAEALGRLTVEGVRRIGSNADKAAGVLNADANRETVISVVKNAIGTGKGVANRGAVTRRPPDPVGRWPTPVEILKRKRIRVRAPRRGISDTGRGQRFSPSDPPRALTGADRRPVREPRTSASAGPQSCMIG